MPLPAGQATLRAEPILSIVPLVGEAGIEPATPCV